MNCSLARYHTVSHPTTISMTSDPTTIPIARIPPELFLLILGFTLNPCQYHTDDIFRPIAYSHVCRSWRAHLFGASDFWSLLDLRYPTIAREFCARSQSCPIRVCFSQSESTIIPQNIPTAFAWLSPHAHRMEGLYLAASQTIIRDVLSVVQPAAPALEQLGKCLSPDSTGGPVLALKIRANKVQRLSLDGFHAIDWSGVVQRLTSLTSLMLTRLGGERSNIPIPQLFSILSNCPRLRCLTLLSALSPWPTEITTIPIVELPELEYLEVSHRCPDDVARLLEHLSFPSTTSLTFHAHGIRNLSSLLPRNLTCLGLAASFGTDDTPVTQLCRISPINLMLMMHRPRTSSTIRFFIAPDDLSHVLRSFPSIEALVGSCSHLSAVTPQPMGAPSAVTMGTWKSAVSSMPALRHIETGGAWAESLLFSLTAATGPAVLPFPPLFPQFEMACPALESVHVLDRSRNDPQMQRFMENVACVLESRYEYSGRKLPLLILESPRESARAIMSTFVQRLSVGAETVDIRSRATAPIALDNAPILPSRPMPEPPSSSSSSSSSSMSIPESKRSS
ncbi:uncharacterized protein C8Q71DRAFT_339710 [Rhodofomes roseus]|uniref:F-box domain-containing protein n=1 Tax=Rhodofomes roseus TaxID=34475 RepID=A0ABQ8KS77_9APHY|nr:uncharacterized protein C8Q71DRAFT_339710 [Rhodofomes roseus]KAH9841597.1 hypothetical protein C8Q71DRAFT_339710 [Rhodofomes roseus]